MTTMRRLVDKARCARQRRLCDPFFCFALVVWSLAVPAAASAASGTASRHHSVGFTQRSTGTAVLAIPRGGGGGGWFGRRRQPLYVRMLQDENLQLERQIRVYQERIQKLRQSKQAALEQQDESRAQQRTADKRQRPEVRKELRHYKKLAQQLQADLTAVQATLEQTLQLKQQVEDLLQAAEERIQTLEDQIFAMLQRDDDESARAEVHQQELAQLKAQLEQAAADQVQAIRDALTQQAQADLQKALQKAEQAAQDRLKKVQGDHAQQCQHYQDTIQQLKRDLDKEKAKQRALIQAMSQHEKRVLAENLKYEQEQQRQRSSKKKKQRAETVRGPMK